MLKSLLLCVIFSSMQIFAYLTQTSVFQLDSTLKSNSTPIYITYNHVKNKDSTISFENKQLCYQCDSILQVHYPSKFGISYIKYEFAISNLMKNGNAFEYIDITDTNKTAFFYIFKNDTLINHIIEYYIPEFSIKSIFYISNSGLKNGKYIEFYLNNKISYITYYLNDTIYGNFQSYDSLGYFDFETQFSKQGSSIGKTKVLSSNKKYYIEYTLDSSGNINGEVSLYIFKNQLIAKYEYKNNIPLKYWTFYDINNKKKKMKSILDSTGNCKTYTYENFKWKLSYDGKMNIQYDQCLQYDQNEFNEN